MVNRGEKQIIEGFLGIFSFQIVFSNTRSEAK